MCQNVLKNNYTKVSASAKGKKSFTTKIPRELIEIGTIMMIGMEEKNIQCICKKMNGIQFNNCRRFQDKQEYQVYQQLQVTFEMVR